MEYVTGDEMIVVVWTGPMVLVTWLSSVTVVNTGVTRVVSLAEFPCSNLMVSVTNCVSVFTTELDRVTT